MRPLPASDVQRLRAAQGWLELGDLISANAELEEISPLNRAHPQTLEVRWHIYSRLKKWDACLDLADAIVKLTPDRPEGWIHRSIALHELKRTKEAFDLLQPIARRFPTEWVIPYNLACYCAQLGDCNESQAWLKAAMAIDEHTVKKLAIEDSDLEPVWESMSNTVWKRHEEGPTA